MGNEYKEEKELEVLKRKIIKLEKDISVPKQTKIEIEDIISNFKKMKDDLIEELNDKINKMQELNNIEDDGLLNNFEEISKDMEKKIEENLQNKLIEQLNESIKEINGKSDLFIKKINGTIETMNEKLETMVLKNNKIDKLVQDMIEENEDNMGETNEMDIKEIKNFFIANSTWLGRIIFKYAIR